MGARLTQLYLSLGTRDLVEIAILTVVIYIGLRFLGQMRGAGMVRGLCLVVIGLFLAAQVVIAGFDLTELSKLLDYLLTTVLVGLLIIFQPELRRGLLLLGRYRVWWFLSNRHHPVADALADAAVVMAKDCVGALVAIQREVSLAQYIETGEAIDGEISIALLRTIFSTHSPLHDGAIIICNGRIAAAACQLPLAQPPERESNHMGMRHRAALGLCEETDAVLLVVSEETGRISIGIGGKLQVVPPEKLSRALAESVSGPSRVPMPSRLAA